MPTTDMSKDVLLHDLNKIRKLVKKAMVFDDDVVHDTTINEMQSILETIRSMESYIRNG